jgi:hypothetical protein
MDVETFLNRVENRSVPLDGTQRVRTLARELAEGALEKMWQTSFISQDFSASRSPTNDPLQLYFQRRWYSEIDDSDLALLTRMGYIIPDNHMHRLTREAFALVDEVQPANVFISYRRSESSAFALLILARFKQVGLEAFVDLSIPAGDDWQKHLRTKIENSEYFILLLGGNTLSSEVVQQELSWAIDADTIIIPVLHNGFDFRADDWQGVIDDSLSKTLASKNWIRVREESALAYNTAVIELLNRFGVTP